MRDYWQNMRIIKCRFAEAGAWWSGYLLICSSLCAHNAWQLYREGSGGCEHIKIQILITKAPFFQSWDDDF